MHRLTGGRYTLGLGRGIDAMFGAYGLPKITTAQIEDFVGIMRRLWHGEAIFGHDGPAGRFPILHLDAQFDEDIPIGLVAFGPNSLALAGRAMDMVVLHTFFTDETVTRAVETVRRGGRSGRARPRGGAHLVLLRHRARRAGPRADPQEDGGSPGHLPAGLRRPAGVDQRLGPRAPWPLPGRRGGVVHARRHRRRGHHRPARTHRHPAARRVAGAGGHRLAGSLRGPGAAPVRPGRGRRHHARRHARPSWPRWWPSTARSARPAVSTTWPPTPASPPPDRARHA